MSGRIDVCDCWRYVGLTEGTLEVNNVDRNRAGDHLLPSYDAAGKNGETMKLTLESTKCPYCGVSLIGQEIPEKDRESFGNATHFQRQIGIEERDDDFISSVMCPDCGAEDAR